MSATIPVHFQDGALDLVGTVTFTVGEPAEINGESRAPMYVEIGPFEGRRLTDSDIASTKTDPTEAVPDAQ